MLYRTNAQSRALEEALRKRAIPYRLVGAVRFYDRREIRDLMSYLKLIANPADDEAFRRADRGAASAGSATRRIEQLAARRARRGRPDARRAPCDRICIAALRPAARAARSPSSPRSSRGSASRRAEAAVDELLRDIVEAIRYDEYLTRRRTRVARDRIENVRELITGAAETVADEEGEVGLTPLDHFLQQAMLVAEVDKLGPDADAVTLMTLHNAKGLEFPVVFITGLEDGLFPLAQGVRRSRAARGGAAPLLRRDHARRAEALPHARRGAPAQRRVHAVASRRAFSSPFPRTCSSSA